MFCSKLAAVERANSSAVSLGSGTRQWQSGGPSQSAHQICWKQRKSQRQNPPSLSIPAPGQVKHATQSFVAGCQKIVRHFEYCFSNIERRCRVAYLIGHDIQIIARFSQMQHGLKKILAEGAVYPCGPEDHMVGAGRRQTTLSLQL